MNNATIGPWGATAPTRRRSRKPRKEARSWSREIAAAVVGGIILAILGFVYNLVAPRFLTPLGLDENGRALPRASQPATDSKPAPPAPPAVHQPVTGRLHLLFGEDVPRDAVVLLQGREVLTRASGQRVRVIDDVPPGIVQVTVRAGRRTFQDITRVAPGETTLQVQLPPARPATGTIVLDLPLDSCADLQVTLDGKRPVPAFEASRTRGFVVPVGVCEVRVRHHWREFTRSVTVREGAHSPVVVSFPPAHLLLEFVEDVPEGTTVTLDGAFTRPTLRGRRCCEFTVEPGSHTVVVQAGERTFRNSVDVDRERAVLAVDLGSKPAPAVRRDQSRPATRPVKEPEGRTYEPSEVWLRSDRLRHQRIRVVGPAKVFTLGGESMLRFRGRVVLGRHTSVNCFVTERVEGEGEVRVVTIEGEVQGCDQGAVTMRNCRVVRVAQSDR